MLADLAYRDEPDVVPRARHAVAEVLTDRDPDLVGAAELVVTELVTNAVLHGAFPVAVRVSATGERVRIEVQDASRLRPVLAQQSTEAMTGRGLALVAALSVAWGVEPADGDGKTVWAELVPGMDEAVREPLDLDDLLAAWDDDDPALHQVRLPSVPVGLLLEAKSHVDNVLRELQLGGPGGVGAALPSPDLLPTVARDFGVARAEIKRQALAAAEHGQRTVDLVLDLPASAADAGERYLAALDELDRHARGARLLTLASPPHHVVFRRWYVQCLVDQLRALAADREPPPTPTLLEALADHVKGLTAQQEVADRLRLLQKVTRELTGAASVEDIASTVVTNAAESLGALSARVVLLGDDGMLRTVVTRSPDAALAQAYPEIPLDADLPGPVVARTRERMLLRNRHEIATRFPALAHLYDSERALHVAPLVVGDHCLGVLALTFLPSAQYDEQAQVELVTALADALAQALERQLALEQLAEANARLQFLADAAVALSETLDHRQTVDALVDLLVPRLADWCVVQLAERGQLHPTRVRHVDPQKTGWGQAMAERYPPPMDAPTGAPQVFRTGETEVMEEVSDEMLQAAAVDEEHLRVLRELGLTSGMTVALVGHSGTLGVMTLLYSDSGRRYSAADVPFVEDVARRAAVAIEHAAAFRDQSGRLRDLTRLAEAAQRAILAPPAPQVGPAALAARYQSAFAEAQIGGDLYEVLPRGDAVRLLIGDVRGKGLAAVRTATVVLGEFRSGAGELDDLAAVARTIDERLRQHLAEEDFVTAVLADLAADGTLTLVSCGHPPVVLVRPSGIELVTCEPALPLGLGAAPVPRVVQLLPGDRLLLATDGLFEARGADGQFVDVEALVRSALHGELEPALDALLRGLHEAVGHEQLGDDLALLLAEYVGAGVTPPAPRAEAVVGPT